jgi:hypothetical protein
MTTKVVTAYGRGAEGYETARRTAEEAMKKLGRKPDIAVVYCDVSYEVREVLRGIREVAGSALVGCTSYGEFTDSSVGVNTISLMLIASDDMKFYTAMVRGLKEDIDRAAGELKEKLQVDAGDFPYRYGLLYMDGFTGVGEEIALAVSLRFPGVSLAGGGAVDMSMRNACVFLDDEAATDAAVLCLILSRKKIGMSVSHGMIPSFGPMEVTKAKGNVVFELDNKPAWETWKSAIAENALKMYGIEVSKLSTKQALPSLMIYQPGLKIDENHYKVRGTFRITPEGAMVFMCGVAEGSELYVMTCTKESLIEAATRGSKEAVKDLGGKPSGALIMDCSVRGILLGDDLPKAVEEIKKGINAPLLGYGAMGEICMTAGQFSGFHNATIVSIVLPE